MQEIHGHCNGPMIVLHGGAGCQDDKGDAHVTATNALSEIAAAGMRALKSGAAPIDVVVQCLQGMERNEFFNSGIGASLQADAQARVTAALMDGSRQSFSGVISAQYITHPSLLARHLQTSDSRVITNPGAELLARKLGIPVETQATPHRIRRWVEDIESGKKGYCDTVGCVLRTADGQLFAGTSTGGRGFEFPGRVSDAATVAGTYASSFAAISATGTGEQIVDDALCARMETRCRDGATLHDASHRCFTEANARQHGYGWIALSPKTEFVVAHTTPNMTWTVVGMDGVVRAS